jgi:hypothetical protein
MLKNKAVLHMIRNDNASSETCEWVTSHGGNSAELWRDCARGDWMAWIIAKEGINIGITRQQLVIALCDCAEVSLKYYEARYPDEHRLENALVTVCLWAHGKATIANVEAAAYTASALQTRNDGEYTAEYAANDAADAVYYAAHSVYAANDLDAGYGVGVSAYAVNATYAVGVSAFYARAAYYVRSAYYAHASASARTAAYAAREMTLAQCADIFRAHFPQFGFVVSAEAG